MLHDFICMIEARQNRVKAQCRSLLEVFNTLGLFPIKFEAEVTVTVHRVVRCTNFVADSDSHLDRSRNNSTHDLALKSTTAMLHCLLPQRAVGLLHAWLGQLGINLIQSPNYPITHPRYRAVEKVKTVVS